MAKRAGARHLAQQSGRSGHGRGRKLVVVHIGWPKTASTFLQRSVFLPDDRVRYIGKPTGKDETALLVRFLRKRQSPEWMQEHSACEPFRALAASDGRPVVISSENLFTATGSIVYGEGPDPVRVARGIRRLQRFCGPEADVRVLLVLRRQDEWLASCYAEQANRREPASQRHFEERVSAILAGDTLRSMYLDYEAWLRAVTDEVGQDVFHPMIFEDLGEKPERFEQTLTEASGLDWAGRVAGTTDEPVWARRGGGNKWRLRRSVDDPRDDAPPAVELTEELSAKIMNAYTGANYRLAEYLGRDLGMYGYY